MPKVSCLARCAGLDGEGVDLFREQVGKGGVDEALARDAGLAGEAIRHDVDGEMAFTRSVMAGMAAMLFAVVDHGEMDRRQGGAQPRLDFCGNGAFEVCGHISYIGRFASQIIRTILSSDPFSTRRFNRFHGRVEGDRPCAAPGCPEPGEFRAPPAEGSARPGDEGPRWRWFCLDHVKAFNQGYNFFTGMSPEEIADAQRPYAGWERETRAFSSNAHSPPPKWSDFSDPLDAIGAKFKERVAKAREANQMRQDGRFLSAEDRKAMSVMGLSIDADRKALRTRYTELLRRYHPDHNGGDRSHEGALQSVIEAYGHLKKASVFA